MKKLGKALRIFFFVLGILFTAMIVLAFTPVPFYMYFHLGQDPYGEVELSQPSHVVMLGGGAMPSEDNLIRLYHASAIARHFGIPVILVHPEDSVCQAEMTRLLRQDGVDSIMYMTAGSNTRSQAIGLKEAFPELTQQQIIVVTSPEHVTRAVKCLRKVGFEDLIGKAAYPATVDFDLSLEKEKLGGNGAVPAVENINMRYNFFNYLKLEITCLREYCALAYYRIKGWS